MISQYSQILISLGLEGRGFESCLPDHGITILKRTMKTAKAKMGITRPSLMLTFQNTKATMKAQVSLLKLN
jgi:hypothetical protein